MHSLRDLHRVANSFSASLESYCQCAADSLPARPLAPVSVVTAAGSPLIPQTAPRTSNAASGSQGPGDNAHVSTT